MPRKKESKRMPANPPVEESRSPRAFHLSIPESRIGPFDPAGAIEWNGRHHLFYLYTQLDDRFIDKVAAHWGHASSDDLVHWTYHPAALSPDLGGADGRGLCWTGDIFTRDGVPTIAYWGDHGQTCLAAAEDQTLVTWKKFPTNPVIPAQPVSNERQEGDHAPFIWQEAGVYYCIRGGHVVRGGDTAFLFRSTDAITWEYLHPLYQSQRRWTETYEDLACPSFFELGGKHVLVGLSHTRGCHYYIGRWEDERFHPEHHGRLNWPGGNYFAPKTYLTEDGRRILWAWAINTRSGGFMAIPRVLTLSDDGALGLAPIGELEILRGSEQAVDARSLPAGEHVGLGETQSPSWEIHATITPRDAAVIELDVLCSSSGDRFTTIRVDVRNETLSIDVARSSDPAALNPADPGSHAPEVSVSFHVDYVVKEKEDVEFLDRTPPLSEVQQSGVRRT